MELSACFQGGNYGQAEPETGETWLAVRRHLSAAADRRGWVLLFVRTEGAALVFQVRAAF